MEILIGFLNFIILIKFSICNDFVIKQFLHTINNEQDHQDNDHIIYTSNILPSKKFLTPIIDTNYNNKLENSVFKTKIDGNSELFRLSIENIKQKNKRNDVIFLIDSSSSIGKQNFFNELKFVKKLLSDFDVSYNYTRISLITFSSQTKIIRHVDQISNPSEDNDKCSLLNDEIPKINFIGGGTFTYGALREAQKIFKNSRPNSKKYIFLVTDGYSNGKDPIPIASKLKEEKVSIFTIGIQSGNSIELYNISSDPKNQYHFLLDTFSHFESLARRALRADYKIGQSIKLDNDTRCKILCQNDEKIYNDTDSCCDVNADCTCGTSSGHYACICHPGYYGSGRKDECYVCPNGTYWHSTKMCRPCPDINHITLKLPALDVSYCVCKSGWRKTHDNRCEGIICPKLRPPENGYFVKQPTSCANVLNSACGVRCKSGYQLLGTSLRVCQENGTWSGIEATCSLKLCPSLAVPYFGMVVCRNRDLDLYYDYSTRNDTFMETYEDETKRITEPMPIDTECTYKCGPGHYLVGSRVRNCLPLSKWDGLQTTCKQVLCHPLPKPLYGEYELSDCTEMKVPHGTNCTILCPEGFNIEGPETKSCIGKKIGFWTHKNKIPKCVDKTPPEIICPKDINLIAVEDFVIVKTLPPPLHLSDSSGMNVSFWIQPIINESTGIELKIGEHIFSYSASDMFNNKAECLFKINILDKTPPIIENCIDPDEFYISSMTGESTFVEWDEPTFHDNSNLQVKVTKSLEHGYLDVGFHKAIYTVTDLFNNSNECVLNITVKERSCTLLPSPLNGQSICAKNSSHTWCEINCNNGYAIFDNEEDSFLENFRITCINSSPKWKYETLPDCTPIDLPNSIEQLLTISLDSDEHFCNNTDTKEKFQKILSNQVKNHLCKDLDDCNIISDIPECLENNEINDVSDKSYYNIVKRDINMNTQQEIKRKNSKNKSKSIVRIKILTKIGKRLGIWKKNHTLSENIRNVKNELKTLNTNDELKFVLAEMRIDIKKLKIEELIRCPDGSVLKKHLCVQCPRGTYQNAAHNRCQQCPIGTYSEEFGQIVCTKCPMYYSTKKFGRKSIEECKQVCPPGTVAKIKTVRKNARPGAVNRKSLMPFCQKCSVGEYQSDYDQTKCLPCPIGYSSYRGSRSMNSCYKKNIHPCQIDPLICGPFGYCVPDQNENSHLYTCICQQGFYGARCEFQFNLCISAPCYNNGICYHTNNSTIGCHCPPQFIGRYCEELKYSCKNVFCRNGGSCVETVNGAVCECSLGYEGEFCEKQLNRCDVSPCESGKCVNSIDGYYCECPPGTMGKRCHLRPCDYLPCHKNAICIDLSDYPTTRNSFSCRCPKGLKGHDCTQIHNPCDTLPCKNNGQCYPFLLKQISNHSITVDLISNFNEEDYEKYTCKCPPYFYGDNCEIFTTPDYVMEFSKSSITSFVELDGPTKSLTEISFCFWIKTNDSFNYGSIISYATENIDNMLTFTDYNGFVLYVYGNYTVTDMVVNDGFWHFICVSWMSQNGFYEIYLDGILRHTGINLSSGEVIENQGIFTIGQEQDQKGGAFSETESFVGSIAYFDIWDNFISGLQVQEFYYSCEPYQGSLYSWTDFKSKIRGDIRIKPSEFCHSCPTDLSLSHGSVRIVDNYAYYQCDIGYILEGNPTRTCLRTSEWTQDYPYCKIVDCRKPPAIENGFLEYTETIYNAEVEYFCNIGFELKGSQIRKCQKNGNWSGNVPECISVINCERFEEYPHMVIYYGNNRRTLNSNLKSFPVGTFVEIFCYIKNETIEVFLTCLENGQWDGELPDSCITTISKHEEIPKNEMIQSFTTLNPLTEHIQNEKIEKTATTEILIDHSSITLPEKVTKNSTNQDWISSKETIFETPEPKTTQYQMTTKRSFVKTTTAQESTTTFIDSDIIFTQTEIQSATIDQYQFTTSSPLSSSEDPYYFSENKINLKLDKDFLINLKNYLFMGCSSSRTIEISNFCKYHIMNSSNYHQQNFSNLENFEPSENNEFQNMDIKLYEYLKIYENLFVPDNNEISFTNFFNIALYGTPNPIKLQRLNSQIENSLRFVFCIYMDVIISDLNINLEQNKNYELSKDDGVDEKLKFLIKKIIIPVYINFQKLKKEKLISDDNKFFYTDPVNENVNQFEIEEEQDEEKELDIEDEDENQCNLQNVPIMQRNIEIIAIKSPNGDLYDFPNIDKDGTYMVYPKTQIIYNCTGNYESHKEIFSECKSSGIWSPINNFCELKWCDEPPQINNMFYPSKESTIKERFKIGSKLQLQCHSGFIMHGNSEIICLKTGKWTRVLARCTKISCGKPKLPENTKILKGRSYLFESKLEIECKNGNKNEVICESDGNWHPNIIC